MKLIRVLLFVLMIASMRGQAMELSKEGYPVFFPENQDEYSCISEYMNKCAIGLLTAIQYDPRWQFEIRPALIKFIKSIQPCITLTGFEHSIPNETKFNGRVLTAITEDRIGDFPNYTLAKLVRDNVSGKYPELVISSYAGKIMKQCQDVYFTCISVSANAEIYAGSSEGKLYIYARNGELLRTLEAHNSPITGIIFTNQGKTLISKEKDGPVFVWNTESYVPKISLENIKYSKDYVFDTTIVRSHADKSALFQYLDSDKVYQLPQTWINPYLFSNDTAKLAFLFLLYRIYHNKKPEPDEKTFNALYYAPVIHTFEPSITYAFKKFIEMKAEENKIELIDPTFNVC